MFLGYILLLTSCAGVRGKDIKILWHTGASGDCVFYAEGMSVEKGKEITDEWNLEDCSVKVNESDKE